MSGYTSESVLLAATAQAVAASQTDQVVSKVFTLSKDDSRYSVFDFNCSGISGTVTAKIQDSHDGSKWYDSKTATISTQYTRLDISADDTTNDINYVPLRPLCRLVITTAGASGATVDGLIRTVRG